MDQTDTDQLEARLHRQLRRESDGAPPPRFTLEQVLAGGRRHQLARRRRAAAGGVLGLLLVSGAAVAVPAAGWPDLGGTPAAAPSRGPSTAPSTEPVGEREARAQARRERRQQLQPRAAALREALGAHLAAAGVQVVSGLEPLPADGVHDHLWQAGVVVRAASGEEALLRFSTRAPGPAPQSGEGALDRTVSDVVLSDVDCGLPERFLALPWLAGRPAPSPTAAPPVELAECATEDLADGRLTLTAYPPSPQAAGLGPQHRQTTMLLGDGGFVSVANGESGRDDEQPGVLTAEQQRALVLDPALRLPARG